MLTSQCEMKFRNDYPYQPPKFRFLTQRIHHPNVYPSGELCISILHRPGEDRFSGEAASERWNVLHGVESVLRSVLLLLDDPEINSAANVDASVKYRDDRPLYDELARNVVKQSLEGLPSDVRMPTEEELRPKPQKVEEDDDFWTPSDEDDFESSFGGSDSDADMDELEDDDDDEDENKDESK